MTTDPTLYSYGERRDYVRPLAKMTRTEFDALAEADRERILTRLRFVAERNDTRTVKGSYGCSIRGATAEHTSTARALIRRFTEVVSPPLDNSTAGRVARYQAATTSDAAWRAVYGATKAQMIAIARSVGLVCSESWKNAKFERVLREHAATVAERPPLAAPGDRVTAPVGGGPEVWTGTVTGWEEDITTGRVWVKWDHDGTSQDMHRAWLTVVAPPEADADNTPYASPWADV